MQQAQKAKVKPLREYVRSVVLLKCNHSSNCDRTQCPHHGLHTHILAGCNLKYCNHYVEGRLTEVVCIVDLRLRVYSERTRKPCGNCGQPTGKVYKSRDLSLRACSDPCAFKLVGGVRNV